MILCGEIRLERDRGEVCERVAPPGGHQVAGGNGGVGLIIIAT